MISSAGGTLRIFGLAAGLAAATMSCAAEDKMPNDTVANGESTVYDEDTADAVTYAGPDSITITDPGETSSTSNTTTQPDPTDADAVTYAGPDESESADPFPETSSESGTDTGTDTGTDGTSSGTDASSTGSTGTGDTETNG